MLPDGAVVVVVVGVEAGAAELFAAVVAVVEVAGVVVAVGGETWGPVTVVVAGVEEA